MVGDESVKQGIKREEVAINHSIRYKHYAKERAGGEKLPQNWDPLSNVTNRAMEEEMDPAS